ncbi:MAG: sigma-54 dependent transcriptional regulator [Deltaproteobacteria bacterium]
MKRRNLYISPYILIPAIFSGISLLAVIVTYHVTSLDLARDSQSDMKIFWLGGAAFVFSFACMYLILRRILNPISKFVTAAEKLPALSRGPDIEDDATKGTEEIEHIHQVLGQVTTILNQVEARELFPEIIGQSRAMRALFAQIVKAAPTDSTVLLTGDSGTGKELAATAIVDHSLRKGKPFVKVNCVAIPEGLLESELFGHEKGAFTGAIARKKGKFELADGGTIFLDEIGDMTPATQAKILRVLQEREFERVGGAGPIGVDVRIIVATHRNLTEMVKTGAFREDLFYRLNVFNIHLPALRERREDIPALVDHFLGFAAKAVRISPQAMQLLLRHHWQGNIRELQNVIERAAVMADGSIEPEHLPPEFHGEPGATVTMNRGEVDGGKPLDERLAGIEKVMIIEALARSGGIQIRAAQLLGINQRSLWHRIKKYGIDVDSLKKLQNL